MIDKDLGLTPKNKEIFEQFQQKNPHLFSGAKQDYSKEVNMQKQLSPSDLDIWSTKADSMPYARKCIAPTTKEQREKERAYWNEVTSKGQSKTQPDLKGAKKQLFKFIQSYCKNKGIEKFHLDDVTKCALNNLIAYFRHDIAGAYSSRKGLWIYGNLGTGKTFIADLFSVFTKYFDLPKQYDVVSAEQIADKVRMEKKLDIDKYIGKKNYCFDDVGQESPVKIYGEQQDVIQKIILRCYRADKKMIITSNLAPQEVAKALPGSGIYAIEDRYKDERTVDRIYKMFNFVPLIGSNKRKL